MQALLARLFLCVFASFLLGSCANYNLHVKGDNSLDSTPDPVVDSLTYSVFAVGDLGYDPVAGLHTLHQMRKEWSQLATTAQSSIILLGDLTEPGGLPSKDEAKQRAAAEGQLDSMVAVLADFPGKVYAVPGEHDLGEAEQSRLLIRMEKYLKKKSDDQIEFIPQDACSGPEDEDLTEDISLIGVNTAWYLANWNKDPEVNGDCAIRDRPTFLISLGEEINGNRDKTTLVAMHHPLEANGIRGGNYTLRQHLLPIPIVGSVIRLLRSVGGPTQDLSSVRYKEFRTAVEGKTDDARNVIFLTAHEHILQYSQLNDQAHQVLAGSGSVASAAADDDGVEFAYGRRGYSRLDFYRNGAVYVTFFAADTKSATAPMRPVYRRKIIENRFSDFKPPLPPVGAQPLTENTVAAKVYSTPERQRSQLYKDLIGEHYRSLYFRPVTAQVVMLDTFYQNGIMPYRRGGGMTTQSLHLENTDGRRFQMRSVRKNPVQLLPGPLEESFAVNLLRDYFTSMHPYGAMMIPRLSRAAQILGAEPLLAYVPKQPNLGKYNNGFGDELYLLEARPDEDWRELSYFANSKNIIGNDDVRDEMMSNWKHRIDERLFLRSRLFDAWIGDWDRHRDQWRWAVQEGEDSHETYLPIPRDRDQAFSNYDGFLFRIVRKVVPDARKMLPFTADMGDAEWLSFNGKWNDRFFLTGMEWKDWQQEARNLQERLNDEVVDQALLDLPKEVQEISMGHFDIDGKLKARRSQIEDYARDYYLWLSQRVNVIGTNDADYFDVITLPDGRLEVSVYDRDSDGGKDERYYRRTFVPSETREVVLYGLEGDDRFEVDGEGKSPIKVRVVGGLDDDEFDGDGSRTRVVLYDAPGGMEIKDRQPNTRARFTNVREYNQYNFLEFKPSTTSLLPLFGFNPDDGVFLGIGMGMEIQGFKIEPYARKHSLRGVVAVRNAAIQLDYLGEFNYLFGYRRDLVVDASFRSPQFVANYFGLGNDTRDPREELGDNQFNRTRQQRITLFPALRLRSGVRAAFYAGPYYESVRIDSTAGRFVVSDVAALPSRVYDLQHFGGLRLAFETNTLARPMLPDQGFVLRAHAQQLWNLNQADRNFYAVGGNLSYYNYLYRRIVNFATRIGVEQVGGEFEFYQGARLGGRTNFRGVRADRWIGNTVFYHNIDLRLALFQLGKGFLPTIGGIISGFDYGRVWLDGENSDTWHTAYGGGIWLAPMGASILSATFFTTGRENRVVVQAGFPF